jgi:dihydrolipoamide dehydrogenase
MYDIIIIGAGPGGYETAVVAAERGLKVVVVEAGPVGGTCLNEGCIPTKSFCRNAEVYEDIKEASVFGVEVDGFKFDFSKVVARKNEVVAQLKAGVEGLMKHKNITFVQGKASFKDANTVVVDSQEYSAANIIVATGSVSASLPIPGADLPGVLTSKEILELEEVPQRLCVIGAGVIGLEFASIFNTFGSQVSVVEYCKDILPRFDTDLAKRLKQSLSKKGIEITTQAQVQSIEQTPEGLKVTFLKKDKEESVLADKVLMAVGRRANLASMNFEEVGIQLERRGVTTNEYMQTSVPNIYAIGDINGRMMLAHAATYQGFVALDHIMGQENSINLDIMPAAVFTKPEAAVVGLTEDECKEKGIKVKCHKSFFRANGKAISMNEPDGFCKLVVAEDGKILGCHMFGAHSADIIQEVCALLNMGANLSDFKSVIHAHPTLCEVLQSAAHS